ncbi:MAG: carbonic anhydrase [Chromatiales bacterium]|nr:carbonic anhydrase [Chromatiales bacterium]
MSNQVPGLEALQRLKDGNERFASNVRALESLLSHLNRSEPHVGQKPVAIILGCSDSRVPAEAIFDQGLGDLFVIRVAGNIVAPSQIGSVEFAVSRYGTRLVVVLGHTHCGAVTATIDELVRGDDNPSENIRSIVSRVRPAIEPLLSTDLRLKPDELLNACVRANVRMSADRLRHGSAIIEDLIANDGLLVVGAEYSLETARVDFFDGVPREVR